MVREIFSAVTMPPYWREVTTPQIREAVTKAEQNYRGWPVLHLTTRSCEQSEDDGLSCCVTGDRLRFYWMISHRCQIYHAFEEHICASPGSPLSAVFDPHLVAIEMAEVLATFAGFYRLLGIGDGDTFLVKFRWSGVQERLIAIHDSIYSMEIARQDERRVREDVVEGRVSLQVGTMPDQIPDAVVRAHEDLFKSLPGGHILDDASVEEWARRCLSRSLMDR